MNQKFFRGTVLHSHHANMSFPFFGRVSILDGPSQHSNRPKSTDFGELELIMKYVPETPGRADIPGFRRFRLDLLPKVADVHVHGPFILQENILPPDRVIVTPASLRSSPIVSQSAFLHPCS